MMTIQDIRNIFNTLTIYPNIIIDWEEMYYKTHQIIFKDFCTWEDDEFEMFFELCPPETPKFIYLIQECRTTHYKIGMSLNPQQRIQCLQISNPNDLHIKYTQLVPFPHELEHYLHTIFSSKNIRGEWFNLSTKDVQKISHILNKFKKYEQYIRGYK